MNFPLYSNNQQNLNIKKNDFRTLLEFYVSKINSTLFYEDNPTENVKEVFDLIYWDSSDRVAKILILADILESREELKIDKEWLINFLNTIIFDDIDRQIISFLEKNVTILEIYKNIGKTKVFIQRRLEEINRKKECLKNFDILGVFGTRIYNVLINNELTLEEALQKSHWELAKMPWMWENTIKFLMKLKPFYWINDF